MIRGSRVTPKSTEKIKKAQEQKKICLTTCISAYPYLSFATTTKGTYKEYTTRSKKTKYISYIDYTVLTYKTTPLYNLYNLYNATTKTSLYCAVYLWQSRGFFR